MYWRRYFQRLSRGCRQAARLAHSVQMRIKCALIMVVVESEVDGEVAYFVSLKSADNDRVDEASELTLRALGSLGEELGIQLGSLGSDSVSFRSLKRLRC